MTASFFGRLSVNDPARNMTKLSELFRVYEVAASAGSEFIQVPGVDDSKLIGMLFIDDNSVDQVTLVVAFLTVSHELKQ